MHILLIDRNEEMTLAWKNHFQDQESVTVLHGDLTEVLCDAIVSPANSFGFMDGGIDYAISERLGWDMQEQLQTMIYALPEGELLVGRALVLETKDEIIRYLISAPTMRVPMNSGIDTSVNAYLAMKAALIAARDHEEITSVAIPGFCTGVGQMDQEVAAHQMFMAYEEVILEKKPCFQDFGEASRHHRKINPKGQLFGQS